ncbi:MAG TPA: F0F1 ATP synthase subunit epsilon [Anaerolineales bacterium]|nr:F0F1 ATP synthase subunit epsilon [Anaerolineales bacterium]
MRLRILLPEQILLDTEVLQVTAEAENGSFGLLPRHVDFVAALVPGILAFITTDEREEFLAVDEGILVKCGADVRVSTRNAVLGRELGELKLMIEERFKQVDEFEKKSRDVLYKMEADLVRRFMELGKI